MCFYSLQDYGPKVNFKKKKVKTDVFAGFPDYCHGMLKKLRNISILEDFRPVELCNLDYNANRGSSIDPHTDDSWLWGDRLVTVNLCSDTVLTLSYPRVKPDPGTDALFSPRHPCKFCCREQLTYDWYNPYNCAKNLMRQTDEFLGGTDDEAVKQILKIVVRVPMPACSCVVLRGDARYIWDHSILRNDVADRRLAMTFRELTQLFLHGGNMASIGRELLDTVRLSQPRK